MHVLCLSDPLPSSVFHFMYLAFIFCGLYGFGMQVLNSLIGALFSVRSIQHVSNLVG
jgi:hypothetical protein